MLQCRQLLGFDCSPKLAMKKFSIPLKALVSIFATALLMTLVLSAAAQSGRRGNKSTQVTPQPSPAAEETPKPSPTPSGPRVFLSIALDDSGGFSRVPLNAQSAAVQGLVDRLNESNSIKVVAVVRDSSRGEAIKKAKSGTDTHVAWIRIEVDRMSADPRASTDIRDMSIEHVLFAPESAKVVGSGRTFPNPNRSVIPNTRTGSIYGDYLFVEAGRATAERILAALSLPTKPVVIR